MKKNPVFFIGKKLVLNDLWAETCLSCLDRANFLCGSSEIYTRLSEALICGNFTELSIEKGTSYYVFSIHIFQFELLFNADRSETQIRLIFPSGISMNTSFWLESKSFIKSFTEFLAVSYSKNFNLLERTYYES